MQKISKTKQLVIMGLLVALAAILGMFTIYVSPTFRMVSFAFLPNSIGSALFGPVPGALMGVATDIVSYFAKPSGGFFPGYTLSAVVTNVIYGLFLYNKPLKLWRVAAAQLLITIVVVFGLNAIWLNMMYGTGGTYFNYARIISNLVMYPIQVGLIMLFVSLSRKAIKHL